MTPTVAGYPVRPVRLTVGEEELTLLLVRSLEAYVDAPALLRDAHAPEPPYWMHVWAGGRALARLVARETDWSGRRVIEIGCGLGLAGLVAARRGAAVTMLDSVGDALRFAVANAALNQRAIAAVQTDLLRPGIRGEFDCCLAADATYDPTLQQAIADFLGEHLAAKGRAWCAESVRTTGEEFHRVLSARGLRATEYMVQEHEEGRLVWVRITEVTRA